MKKAFVKSRITGGHWAFQTEHSNKPFTNKLTEAFLVQLNSKDVVADVGAYVGEFSLYAARQGVKCVKAFEPTPNTFKLLAKNTKMYSSIKCYNQAVVGDNSKHVTLHISPGIGVTNSIAKMGKAKSVEVKAINYNKAIKGCSVVKIDCEGAEYSFDIIQPSLRAIILEFHPIVGVDWRTNAKNIMKSIRNAGFKALAEPKFENGWDMHAAYVRSL